MTLSYTAIESNERGRMLVQVTRRNKAGKILRISSYLAKSGAQTLVSEQLYYPDNTSRLYFYNEQGEVWQLLTYDKDGHELSDLIKVS